MEPPPGSAAEPVGDPVVRPTVRGVLVDPTGRLLLIHATAYDGGDPVWFLPGGGVEPGESPAEALTREVAEETGYRDATAGAEIWRRTARTTIDGTHYELRERYFLVLVPAYEPRPTNLTPYERALILGLRWWTADELRQTPERLVPPELVTVCGSFLVPRGLR